MKRTSIDSGSLHSLDGCIICMTVLFNPLNLFISLQKAFCKPATVLFLYLKAVHLPDLSFSFKGRGLLLWVGGSGGPGGGGC